MLQECRECTTMFPPDLLCCPHCQTEVTVKSEEDDTEDAPVTVTGRAVELPNDAPPLPTDK